MDIQTRIDMAIRESDPNRTDASRWLTAKAIVEAVQPESIYLGYQEVESAIRRADRDNTVGATELARRLVADLHLDI